jgi:hypothetical protein
MGSVHIRSEHIRSVHIRSVHIRSVHIRSYLVEKDDIVTIGWYVSAKERGMLSVFLLSPIVQTWISSYRTYYSTLSQPTKELLGSHHYKTIAVLPLGAVVVADSVEHSNRLG